MGFQVHILPREILGVSTFAVATVLLKWLPLPAVDNFLVTMANFTLGTTAKLGLRRPKTGPLELKKATGRAPVLDFGALKQNQWNQRNHQNRSKFRNRATTHRFRFHYLGNWIQEQCAHLAQGLGFVYGGGNATVSVPNGWKGGNGLYAEMGFTRAGLLGTASDTENIARDISDQGGGESTADSSCTRVAVLPFLA